MKLEMPVVLYLDKALTVDNGEGLRARGASFQDERTLIMKASVKKNYKETPGWVLEANGNFRELRPLDRRRQWAEPLSFLIQFVQSQYAVSEPRVISVGELKKHLKGVRDKFSDAPVASDLRRFLDQHNDDEPVTREMLKAWPIG